jgi:hypothetical protein
VDKWLDQTVSTLTDPVALPETATLPPKFDPETTNRQLPVSLYRMRENRTCGTNRSKR